MKRFLSLLLLLGATAASARPAAPSTTAEPTVAAPASEVGIQKIDLSAWERILKGLPRVSGYLQLGYDWDDAGTSTFRVKRVRLSLDGDILPKLDYRVQVELAKPQLVDAYLRYKPFDALNFQLGEYKIPFGIENTEYGPLNAELIDCPVVLQRLMGISEQVLDEAIRNTGRDMGLQVYGSFWKKKGYSILDYNLGVFNGEGINTADRNKSKDIFARVMLHPVEGLTLSGSYYRGEFGPDYIRRNRYSAGAAYDRTLFSIRAEWIGGRTGELDSDGWYALLGWRATRTLMPVVRYELFREDTSRRESHQQGYSAGLVWHPVKSLRCQLNYRYEDYRSSLIANRNVVQVLLTGMF